MLILMTRLRFLGMEGVWILGFGAKSPTYTQVVHKYITGHGQINAKPNLVTVIPGK